MSKSGEKKKRVPCWKKPHLDTLENVASSAFCIFAQIACFISLMLHFSYPLVGEAASLPSFFTGCRDSSGSVGPSRGNDPGRVNGKLSVLSAISPQFKTFPECYILPKNDIQNLCKLGPELFYSRKLKMNIARLCINIWEPPWYCSLQL